MFVVFVTASPCGHSSAFVAAGLMILMQVSAHLVVGLDVCTFSH